MSTLAPSASPSEITGWQLVPGSNSVGVLRLVFAGCVLLSHSWDLLGRPANEPLAHFTNQGISFGSLGVDGFFIISGYLITKSWQTSRSSGDYLARRVLRIYPGFLVATVFCYLVVVPLGSSSGLYGLGRIPVLDGAIYALLLSAPPQISGVLGDVPVRGQIDGSMWTILIEFGCYLAILALGRVGLLRRAWPVLAILVGVVGLAWLVSVGATPPNSSYRLFEDFAIGSAFFLCRSRIPRSVPIALGSGLLFLGLTFAHGQLPAALQAAVPFAEAYLVFSVAAISVPLVEAFQRLGDFSYGIYLYAFPVQQLCLHFAGPSVPPLVVFVAGVVGTIPLAVASWYLVEQPALRLSRSRRLYDRLRRPRAQLPGREAALVVGR